MILLTFFVKAAKLITTFIYLLYNRTRSTEHTHTKKNRPKKHKINS